MPTVLCYVLCLTFVSGFDSFRAWRECFAGRRSEGYLGGGGLVRRLHLESAVNESVHR
jgi:hypothetical protein